MDSKMYCAECGKQMSRADTGAWTGCCHNAGYWTDAKPLPQDAMFTPKPVKGLYLYTNLNWGQYKTGSDGVEFRCSSNRKATFPETLS